MGTICNMGAEIGATTSLFPYTDGMAQYLRATNREKIAEEANKYQKLLNPDEKCEYDKVIKAIRVILMVLIVVILGHRNRLEHPPAARKRSIHSRSGPSNRQARRECEEEQLATGSQGRSDWVLHKLIVRRYGQICLHRSAGL